MATQIIIPEMGESVTEGTIARWFKQVGDTVVVDEPLVEVETDKVTVEIPAPTAGTLSEIAAGEGVDVEVGAVIGAIAEGEGAAPAPAKSNGTAAAPETGPSRGRTCTSSGPERRDRRYHRPRDGRIGHRRHRWPLA